MESQWTDVFIKRVIPGLVHPGEFTEHLISRAAKQLNE